MKDSETGGLVFSQNSSICIKALIIGLVRMARSCLDLNKDS